MRAAAYSGQFKRDVRRAQKRGKDMGKLTAIMALLIEGTPLSAEHLDHPLRGDRAGFRDAHIEPDWLLIYKIDEIKNEVRFERAGRHTDLFDGY